LPEVRRRLQGLEAKLLEIGFVLCEDDGTRTVSQRALVALENCVAGCTKLQVDLPMVSHELHAGGQAYQVVGIGQRVCLVEVVDTPAEAPLHVAPGSEAAHMQIAEGKNPWGASEVGADHRPELGPPVEGAAEEGEDVLAHLVVLFAKRSLDHGHAAPHPAL